MKRRIIKKMVVFWIAFFFVFSNRSFAAGAGTISQNESGINAEEMTSYNTEISPDNEGTSDDEIETDNNPNPTPNDNPDSNPDDNNPNEEGNNPENPDNNPETTDEIKVPTDDPTNPIISVLMPVTGDNDPFNFFIDPNNILYNSFHDREDIYVEENANLLFINRTGDVLGLSGLSDKLSIVNQSTVPVEVTVTARVENLSGINLLDNSDFGDSKECDLYLALVDEDGDEIPLNSDGEIVFKATLEKAPLEAYAYVLDPETGEYRYSYQFGEVDFDTYSFGLKGNCNKEGDWANVPSNPKVVLTWEFEPIIEVNLDSGIITMDLPSPKPVLPDNDPEKKPDEDNPDVINEESPDTPQDNPDVINEDNPDTPQDTPDVINEDNPDTPQDNPDVINEDNPDTTIS